MNNEKSGKFRLGRGTRLGCPLSLLLFAITMDPLAIALRSSIQIKGFRIGELEEKVALYDLLLFRGNMQDSGKLWELSISSVESPNLR